MAFIGYLVYQFALRLPEDPKGLLVNIAASLISIPIIFVLYDIWNEKSHKKLYEYAYDRVDNAIYEVIDNVEDIIKFLMHGYPAYFEYGFIEIDDSDPRTVKVAWTSYGKRMVYAERDEEYFDPNYTEEDYIRDMDRINDEAEYKGGIYGFDKSSIVPFIVENEYLGYQVEALDLEDICETVDGLLRNTFIMDRIDEEQLIKVLRLIDAIKALSAFISRTEYLFCEVVDRDLEGFSAQELDAVSNNLGSTGAYSLSFSHDGLTKELDRSVLFNVERERLTSVYVINPDHCIMFGDLIHEVTACMAAWQE